MMEKTTIQIWIVLAITIGHGSCQNITSRVEIIIPDLTSKLEHVFGNAQNDTATPAKEALAQLFPSDNKTTATASTTIPTTTSPSTTLPPSSSVVATTELQSTTTPRPTETTVGPPLNRQSEKAASDQVPLSVSCIIEKTNTKGECTPYYLCSNESTILTAGSVKRKIIDLRIQGECPLLNPCCAFQLPEPRVPIIHVETGCGYRNPHGLGFQILNEPDRQAQEAEFPWSVAILVDEKAASNNNITTFQCGGSLIHPQVVMTVAHCINRYNRQSLFVRAGEWDSLTTDEYFKHQDREVSEIIIHNEFSEDTAHKDIALLILRTPFIRSENVNTICLPAIDAKIDQNTCYAAGWGQKSWQEKELQSIMKKIELPIVPSDQCQETLRTTRLGPYYILDDSFICAGGEVGKDTCTGDGGSPLMCRISGTKDRFYQAGIVSWGIGCGDAIPGVYVNVPYFKNWIDSTMSEKGFDMSTYTYNLHDYRQA